MGEGQTTIEGYLDAADTRSTIAAVEAVGARVEGVAGQEGESWTLDGDDSIRRRPVDRIAVPLTEMGARLDAREGRLPPLRISGAPLHGITYAMPVASAQVKSCLLFAGLLADGETRIEEPVRTRDHGELALRAFGAEVARSGNEVRIRGGQTLRGIEARVPGDLSSAAFFLCAAALFPGSHLLMDGLLMNPTRARLLDILMQMGLEISVTQLDEVHGEMVGTIQVEGGPLTVASIDAADTAALIDEITVLAAIAPYTEQGIEVRDAK